MPDPRGVGPGDVTGPPSELQAAKLASEFVGAVALCKPAFGQVDKSIPFVPIKFSIVCRQPSGNSFDDFARLRRRSTY